MREVALQKRRKAAEELLQWHQRLIEEEEKIAELELAATAIINQVPTVTNSMVSDEPASEKHKFKGSQLNLLWYNMTGREEKKFNDHMTYTMSKISLERFCKDAKKHAIGRNKSFNSKKSGKVSDSDSSLSAIDITVTELTQSKYKNNSNSEKSKKSKSPSSEIDSQIVISQNKSRESQEYTSDFESLLSINKESGLNTVSTDDEQKILNETTILHSLKNHSYDSKMSSVGENSQSDKDVETIAEQSKSIRNILTLSKTNEIVEENVLINEQSSVAIIDDNSTSTNKSNHNNYNNKISDVILENFNNISTTQDIDNVSISIDKNEKLVEDLKVAQNNQDSTSKDVSTDIEHDEKESEISELNSIKDNASDIINLSSQQVEITSQTVYSVSNEFVPSEHISSNATNKEIVYNLISKSNDVEEDIVSRNDQLSSPSEDQLLSTTNKAQSLSKTNDDQLRDKTKADQLLSKTNEDQSLSKTNEDYSLDKTNEDQSLSKTTEDQLLIKTNENHSLVKTNEDHSLGKTSEDQLLSKTTEDQLVSKTNEDRSLDKTNEDHSLGKTNEDQSLSKTSEDQLLSKTNEDRLVSKTNEYQSLSKTNEDQSFSQADRPHSKTNDNQPTETYENELLGELNENQFHNKTNENKLLRKSDEAQLLSATDENLSKTDENEFPTKTDKDDLLSKSNENQLFVGTNKVTTHSKTNDKSNDHISNEDLERSEAQLIRPVELSELSLNKSLKSVTNKENENRILMENKPNRLNIDASEIKTIESDDDTEIVSDEEWNQLSRASQEQQLNKMNESSCIESVPEINNEEKEDSIKTTNSISEKIESPLLLSYGFVEEKKSNDLTEFEKSALDADHIEDTLQQGSLQNSINTESSFGEKKYPSDNDKKVEGDVNKFSENYRDDKNLTSNINHTSSNQFEDDLSQTSEIHKKPDIDLNQTYEVNLEEENKEKVDVNENNEEIDEKKITTELDYIDVKKRVSEILADANIPSPRGDKSPRLQDLYVTAYDVVSPEHSSSSGSPIEDIEQSFTPPRHMYGSDEVEELLKKQLEIEQEIKEIQQQQQKEHIPYLYVREIPNKPPPPYTPPVSIQTPVSGSILPATEKQIGTVAKSAANLLHKAYLNKNLQNVTLSADDLKRMQSEHNIDNNCFEFVFDLCKEAAIDHYNQFETETGPSWMHLTKRSKLAIGKPLDRNGLEKFITTKVRQWLGYETVKSTENIKRKWSGKKRDHVDELLVLECQAEETEWTNYDRDELIVKDELTKDIMNMLLSETAQVFNNILNKKTFLC